MPRSRDNAFHDDAQGSEVNKDYPSLPKWVWDSLPEYWRQMVFERRALIVKDPKRGWCLCYSIAGEFKCYKILRKSDTMATIIAKIFEKMCLTIKDFAWLIGLDYQLAKGYIYYYKQASLLRRSGFAYCLNYEHPQVPILINSSIEGIIKRLFFKGKNWEKLVKIGKKLTDSEVSESLNENERVEWDVKTVLSTAVEMMRRDLDPMERLLIEKLLEWYRETGNWWVCAENSHELFDLLNINNISVYPELERRLKGLERRRIVIRWYNWRDREHCVRINNRVIQRAIEKTRLSRSKR